MTSGVNVDIVRDVQPQAGQPPQFTGPVQFTYHSADAPTACAKVQFGPGGRTAWHSHPEGQVLYVLDGTTRVQERGGPVEDVGPGQSVVCPAGIDHWHGAAPGHTTTHLAIHSGPVRWAEPVAEADYVARTGESRA